MVTLRTAGTVDGKEVREFTISDGELSVSVYEYGATVHSVVFRGVDCAAGYDDLPGFLSGGSYQGATVGRYANRIGGASFEMGGKRFFLDKNDGANSLHGGFDGLSFKVMKGEKISDRSVRFSCGSPDGEGGFPGNLAFSVTFSVADGTLSIKYEAESDRDTVMNFTNHTYFTLGAESCLKTELMIAADGYTPTGEGLIPTGEIADVTGTPFDFRVPKEIGRDIGSDHPQVRKEGGFDHNFVLRGAPREFRRAAEAFCPETGIGVRCSTDMPGVQLYTANVLDEPRGKGGAPLSKYRAFCLETQFFPDTPNKPEFPSCAVKAGEKFESVTEYEFFAR